MSGQHAVFSPSKSDTWANCAGALALCKDIPEPPTSEFAASGTLTHELAEFDLTMPTGALEGQLGETCTVDGFTFTVDAERIERVLQYTNAVRARGGVQFYEVSLDLKSILGLDGQSGTADAVVCLVDEKRLEVHDLKDGVGIVAPTTKQLLCYAGAAMFQFGYLCEWQDIEVYIHQPRVRTDAISQRWTRKEIFTELAALATAAQKADRMMKGMQALEFTPGDKQCKWCPARGSCAARSEWIAGMFPVVTARAAALTDAELAELLNKRAVIEAAFDSWAMEALNRARLGGAIPGWKLAQGRQGNRKWGDAPFAERILNAALAGDAYKRTLLDPPDAEKRLKKTHPSVWAELQPSIVRSEGQVTLVPDVDPRQPLPANIPEFEIVDNGTDLLGAL